jgi:hypothetical protein
MMSTFADELAVVRRHHYVVLVPARPEGHPPDCRRRLSMVRVTQLYSSMSLGGLE